MTSDGVRPNGSFDSALREKVGVTLEVLMNITYLTMQSAESPVPVRHYMTSAEDSIANLITFMGTTSKGLVS